MWVYQQSTGILWDPKGKVAGKGFSGQKEGFNNPAMESTPHIGPLPVGLYDIGVAFTHPHLGPLSMQLTPHKENVMYGRSQFFFHGYSVDDPKTQENEMLLSSHGCICQIRTVRKMISDSKDKLLKVIK